MYLTEEEIPRYCTVVAGVDTSDVLIASNLIDGYLGRSFSVNTASETISINDKKRGKLRHYPIISIDEVYQIVRTEISITKNKVDSNNVFLDAEDDGYFSYIPTRTPFGLNIPYCYARQPLKIEVKYTYGYKDIPEDIKIVTGMLAQNIRQASSFVGYKKLNTLDYTVEMGNPSFFTDDMRTILDKYRGI